MPTTGAFPADGKFFPDGVKIVKIEWSFKKNPVSPYFVQVPDALQAVDVIEKDTERFPNTHGWAYANFVYDAASDTFTPRGPNLRAGLRATPLSRRKITSSRNTLSTELLNG